MALTVEVREGHSQVDGRKFITEIFSDAIGPATRNVYLAPNGLNYRAIAIAKIPRIEEILADFEAEMTVKIDVSPTLRFQTGMQFLGRVREMYRNATNSTVCRLATWLTRRIQDGSVTQAQLRNAFGLTQAQWDALKLRMDALRDHMNAVDAARGE